jgi:hypothetical protein
MLWQAMLSKIVDVCDEVGMDQAKRYHAVRNSAKNKQENKQNEL